MTTKQPVKTGGSNLRQQLLNTFMIDHESEVDSRRYKGKFVSKKLTIRDIAALGVRKSQLNGGMHHDAGHPGYGVDEQTDEFNNMIAHLELSIVEAPDWWNLDEITDVTLLGYVYKEVVTFENTFLGRGGNTQADGGSASGDSEGSGQEDTSPTKSDGNTPTVVGKEVSNTLEP